MMYQAYENKVDNDELIQISQELDKLLNQLATVTQNKHY
ncbi:aspartyl-phosphate phosphatase Spo0E family protein [Oceanobacillus luteolus]|nr:aspartyl-phosphate phosphatase Spo0E family protein [Oceanobacillus luteolus]